MKKSQGEIFGIALMFVIIILGITIYTKFQAANPNNEVDSLQEGKYKILAQSTLNSLKKLSTNCEVDQGSDSLEDLITYCMDFSSNPNSDFEITCNDGVTRNSCSYSIELLNKTLQKLFLTDSKNSVMGGIPFSLEVTTPEYNHRVLNGSFTNLNKFQRRGYNVSQSNYRQLGFKRIPAGKEVIPTQKRVVELTLDLYY